MSRWFNASVPDDKGGRWQFTALPGGNQILEQIQAGATLPSKGTVIEEPPYVRLSSTSLNGSEWEADSVMVGKDGNVVSGILKYF